MAAAKNAAGVHGKERTIRVRRGDGRLSAPEGARAFSGSWRASGISHGGAAAWTGLNAIKKGIYAEEEEGHNHAVVGTATHHESPAAGHHRGRTDQRPESETAQKHRSGGKAYGNPKRTRHHCQADLFDKICVAPETSIPRRPQLKNSHLASTMLQCGLKCVLYWVNNKTKRAEIVWFSLFLVVLPEQ